jgi:hypothetical protein
MRYPWPNGPPQPTFDPELGVWVVRLSPFTPCRYFPTPHKAQRWIDRKTIDEKEAA